MNTSPELKNIYTAIIKARPEIAPIARTKSTRNYRYATLDTIIELLSLVLPKHGLGWVQTLSSENEKPVLVTRIIHESGEWIEDALALPQTKLNGGANESQELGASITYFKRYALSAMFGIATDDDTDGVADVRDRKQQVKANARAAGQPQPQASGESDEYEKAANAAGYQIHNPTPEKPVEAVGQNGNICNFNAVIKTTGDEAIDRAIAETVAQQYKGRPLFSQKTVAWLNGMIEKKTPQEALACANAAANKMINKIDSETTAA